ncbi:MAG: four helix bundle protein [Pirellulales bacterium]
MRKTPIVEEEADEAIYCLELLADAAIIPQRRQNQRIDELNPIRAMIVASRKTLRRKHSKSKR